MAAPLDMMSARTCTDGIQTNVAGSQLSFDAEAIYTFHWGDSKVYVILRFKLQGRTPFVGVAFLTGSGRQDVCTNLSYFLFCHFNNVGTKYNPFPCLEPTYRCAAGSYIKCFKR
jgi:hypothetical protein